MVVSIRFSEYHGLNPLVKGEQDVMRLGGSYLYQSRYHDSTRAKCGSHHNGCIIKYEAVVSKVVNKSSLQDIVAKEVYYSPGTDDKIAAKIST